MATPVPRSALGKAGLLFFGAAALMLAGYSAHTAHPDRRIACTHAAGCELREGTKVLARHGDIVSAGLLASGQDKHNVREYKLEIVTTTGTLREDKRFTLPEAEARLAPIAAYTRRETESLDIYYPSTWGENLGLIVPFGLIGLVLIFFGVKRRGSVDLTFDGHERKVFVRTSGLPSMSATWPFADVVLEVERGIEDKEGRALCTLTLRNIDGTCIAIARVPGGEAKVAAERVREVLAEPGPEYR